MNTKAQITDEYGDVIETIFGEHDEVCDAADDVINANFGYNYTVAPHAEV